MATTAARPVKARYSFDLGPLVHAAWTTSIATRVRENAIMLRLLSETIFRKDIDVTWRIEDRPAMPTWPDILRVIKKAAYTLKNANASGIALSASVTLPTRELTPDTS